MLAKAGTFTAWATLPAGLELLIFLLQPPQFWTSDRGWEYSIAVMHSRDSLCKHHTALYVIIQSQMCC
jgi:hypothetical protein